MTSVECPTWRAAWAERENERRRHTYRTAIGTWRRRGEHLTRLRIEAAGFLGCTQPRTGLPVDLDDDELVFRILPVADLVEAEARHVPGLPAPGPLTCAETVSDTVPPGLRVIDTGMAVVTSHRVAFASREHRREWRYAELTDPAHHPDVPVTLLPDHDTLGGLRVPANAVVNFRFYLALAIAAAAGDRADVVAEIDALLAGHRRERPTPPPPAEPDEAPLIAVRPDRRALAAAAVATVVVATLGPAVGPPQAGPAPRTASAVVAVGPPRAVGPVTFQMGTTNLPTPAAPTRVTGAAPAGPSNPAQPVRPVAPSRTPAPPAAPPTAAAPPAAPAIAPVASTVPAPPTAPAPSASVPPTPPTPSPSPTATGVATTTPPPLDLTLLTACLDPLLPLVDRLLCPPAES
ncbi:hypothetical protein F4558_004309 [Micromonospora profundi]|uniref:hypothetical protein n=1 Tax=Micromonospora profundi TaxID=1420889 RepID=UPI00143B6AEB|nr:hypothetical protein [Micromonospora profundi]NJC14483.1 hypothetical protein [Micromonospora profundi]